MAGVSGFDEYASVDFDETDEMPCLNLVNNAENTGEYNTVVQNIFNRQSVEIRASTEASLGHIKQISKARLRDLILKHNNEIFEFFKRPEKTPSHFGVAESLCRKYGRDVPSYSKGFMITKDLNIDCSMNETFIDIDTNINCQGTGQSNIQDLLLRLKWLCNQYIISGEEMMGYEKTLVQKLATLDNINKRIPLLANLQSNDALPELIDAFEKYTHMAFETLDIETVYTSLVRSYKKWNLLREIISLQSKFNTDTNIPICSICLSEHVSHAIVPCGHTLCTSCIRKLNTSCYICRGVVRERLKLFFN